MRSFGILVALFAGLATAWVSTRPGRRTPPLAGPARPGPVAARLALLVGIDRCEEGTPFPPLQGCVADVRAARALLESRFGFARDDVLLLQDEQATHAAIVRAWREFLVARAGPGSEAVFWFAGHGSQVPDPSGKDGSGTGHDQTLIAWDSRSHGEDGAYDLSDDELYVLERELAARGARLLAVTDACHSATVMRGGSEDPSARARGADRGRRPLERARIAGFWQGLEWIDDDDPRRGPLAGFAHISACAAEQNAYERVWFDAGGSGRPWGVLDYFLLQELRGAQPDESCASVLRRVAANVRAAGLRQDPACDTIDERPLFGGAFAPAPRGFRARLAEGGLWVEAGELLGLVPGSVLAVEDGTGRSLAEPAVVELCTQLSSRARWPGAAAVAPGAELFAREERRACGSRLLKLSAAPETHAVLPEAAWPRLLELAELVPAGPQAELALEREAPEAGLVLRDAQGLRLWSEAADRARSGAAFDLPLALRREFVAELSYRALLAVPASTRIKLSARFLPLADDDWGRVKEELRAAPRFDTRLRRRGELAGEVWSLRAGDERSCAMVKLALENVEPRALWFNVLSVCEDRTRHLVTADGQPLKLEPGERQSLLIQVAFPPGLGIERALLDHYLVIATPVPADLSPLVRSEVRRGAEPRSPGLPEILESARLSLVERGSSRQPVRVDAQDYGIRLLDLLIERAP